MTATLALRAESSRVPSLVLPGGTFVLGRSSKCGLLVRHDTVSRRHAEITVSEHTITILDLDSRNGTFIDHQRVRTGVLRVGQQAKFGSVVFMLALDASGLGESISELPTANGDTPSARESALANLSKAQRRVFVHLIDGLAEKQVAGKLHISQTTVHNHVQAIYRAFEVHSRPELLARTRWLDPNSLEMSE